MSAEDILALSKVVVVTIIEKFWLIYLVNDFEKKVEI